MVDKILAMLKRCEEFYTIRLSGPIYINPTDRQIAFAHSESVYFVRESMRGYFSVVRQSRGSDPWGLVEAETYDNGGEFYVL